MFLSTSKAACLLASSSILCPSDSSARRPPPKAQGCESPASVHPGLPGWEILCELSDEETGPNPRPGPCTPLLQKRLSRAGDKPVSPPLVSCARRGWGHTRGPPRDMPRSGRGGGEFGTEEADCPSSAQQPPQALRPLCATPCALSAHAVSARCGDGRSAQTVGLGKKARKKGERAGRRPPAPHGRTTPSARRGKALPAGACKMARRRRRRAAAIIGCGDFSSGEAAAVAGPGPLTPRWGRAPRSPSTRGSSNRSLRRRRGPCCRRPGRAWRGRAGAGKGRERGAAGAGGRGERR